MPPTREIRETPNTLRSQQDWHSIIIQNLRTVGSEVEAGGTFRPSNPSEDGVGEGQTITDDTDQYSTRGAEQ